MFSFGAAKAGGKVEIVTRDGKVIEIDTFTCCHCQRIVHVPPKADPSLMGGWCFRCNKPHCNKGRCAADAAKYTCRPFEQWLDMKERSGRFRRLIDEETARRM